MVNEPLSPKHAIPRSGAPTGSGGLPPGGPLYSPAALSGGNATQGGPSGAPLLPSDANGLPARGGP